MKQQLIFSILFLVFTCSCNQSNTTASDKVKKDKYLLAFTAKMIYTVDSLEKLDNKIYQAINSSVFNPKTDTIDYRKNKIHISYLRNAAGCADYVGDIKINKDTLKLLLINTSCVVCTEENTWRLVYEIENKDNRKYVITKY
jgi:hypothetical protein